MTPEYIDNALKAGSIAAKTLAYGRTLVVRGASYKQIYRKLLTFIEKEGGFPAFPPQLSFDHTAAHFMISPKDDVVLDRQLVKLDVGVSVDGAIGDNACTIDLSGEHTDLVQASVDALEAVRNSVKVGMTLGDIGKTIQGAIQKKGFEPIRNLSGHSLQEYVLHAGISIPNYDTKEKYVLKPNMHFACEPFATTGEGMIVEIGAAEIFSVISDVPIRDRDARTILKFVLETYGNLPFSSLDLAGLGVSDLKLKLSLQMLLRNGNLRSYPPLVERSKGMVSQAEHTFLILPDGTVKCTTFFSN